jgi:hypothetical protein
LSGFVPLVIAHEAERRRADRLDTLLAEERQASAELRRLLTRALGEG